MPEANPPKIGHHLIALAGTALAAAAAQAAPCPDDRAATTEKAMHADERTTLTIGIMALPMFGDPLPKEAILGAGYVAGIPRLGVPALTQTDASLGVAYVGGARKDGATALPSGMAMGATWNAPLLEAAGAMIAGEAHAKGFNVLLAGGINLVRDPRNGRNFEYLGEDPLHSGLLGGAAVAGIQSQHVISTVKHFALNGQETGRHFVDVIIDEAAARESDLLAFEIAIERGQPGAVMSSYNKVNGAQASANDWLLNGVLKRDWHYKGWVMSDWGSVDGVESALAGLDQQMGAQLDKAPFFGAPLAAKAASDPAYATRVADMNRRILRSMYAVGVDTNPPVIKPIDLSANAAVAEAVAKEAIVLLRNNNNALPLAASAKSIAVIGGYADSGVLSGGGSSQVQGMGGPAINVPIGGDGPFAPFMGQFYHRSVPLKAIRAHAPNAEIRYRNGNFITDAVTIARKSDIAIIFATQWTGEGMDVPDLSLPYGQDALIAAVTAANPNTIVVLETGGPVMMPWLDKTAAVIEAWYPGARGGEAIASVLFGDTNPSGRLPVSFPASLDQLPRPKLDGSDTLEPRFDGRALQGETLSANYNIEGADVGYRWFARKCSKPLFPFGYGLSYTSFETGALHIDPQTLTASFSVRNSGARAGAVTPQLYLVNATGSARQRLAGFTKLTLAPGAAQQVEVKLDPRTIARWEKDGWNIAAGRYSFALGNSATDLGTPVEVTLAARHWKP